VKALIALAASVFAAVALVCLSGFAFLSGASACSAAPATPPPTATSTAAPGSSTPGSAAPDSPAVHTAHGTWDAEQMQNATIIAAIGASRGVPTRGQIIALATAMQESSLRNLGHLGGNNDHDSLGLFQQRPSQGWGTPAQILDPVYASGKFYGKLLTISGWQTMALEEAAQAVQGSLYPDRYSQWETDATQLYAAIGGPAAFPPADCTGADGPPIDALPSGFSLPPGTPPAAATAVMWALAQLGTPYSFGGDCTAAHSGNPARQCDCSSLVQMAYRAAGISLPRLAHEQTLTGVAVPGPALIQPGDLVFIPGSDGTFDSPGHVAMYIGNNLLVHAPQTGDVVRVTRFSSYWIANLAALRRVA
jgi:cell wall-associated NlpC family hydrolase